MVTEDVLQVHEVANNSQDEHADDGIHGGPATAHQAGAANDDRCDYIRAPMPIPTTGDPTPERAASTIPANALNPPETVHWVVHKNQGNWR
jgi:hypothetical protein